MRILKFKSQLMFAFFGVVNHLSGPLGKQLFTSMSSKVMACDLWLVDFNPFGVLLCSKVCYVMANMIDGSKKHNRLISTDKHLVTRLGGGGGGGRDKTKEMYYSLLSHKMIPLFYSPKPWSQVWIFICWNWSIVSWILNFRVRILLKVQQFISLRFAAR